MDKHFKIAVKIAILSFCLGTIISGLFRSLIYGFILIELITIPLLIIFVVMIAEPVYELLKHYVNGSR